MEKQGTPSSYDPTVQPKLTEDEDLVFDEDKDLLSPEYTPVLSSIYKEEKPTMSEEEADKLLDSKFGYWKPLAAGVLSAGEGVLPFTGEISAAMTAGTNWWNSLSRGKRIDIINEYYKNLEKEERLEEAVRIKYPKSSLILNLAGGLASGAALAGLATKMPIALSMISEAAGASAKVGKVLGVAGTAVAEAGLGAAYMAGASKGDLREKNRAELLDDMALGAFLGAAPAIIFPTLGAGVGATRKWASRALSKELAKEVGENLLPAAESALAARSAEEALIEQSVSRFAKGELSYLQGGLTFDKVARFIDDVGEKTISALASLATPAEWKAGTKFINSAIRKISKTKPAEAIVEAKKDAKAIFKMASDDAKKAIVDAFKIEKANVDDILSDLRAASNKLMAENNAALNVVKDEVGTVLRTQADQMQTGMVASWKAQTKAGLVGVRETLDILNDVGKLLKNRKDLVDIDRKRLVQGIRDIRKVLATETKSTYKGLMESLDGISMALKKPNVANKVDEIMKAGKALVDEQLSKAGRVYRLTPGERAAAGKAYEEAAVAMMKLKSTLVRFGSQMESKASSLKRVKDILSKEQDALPMFRQFRLGETMRKIVKDKISGGGLVAAGSPFWKRVVMFLADARYVYEAIDDKWGTNLLPTLDSLIESNYAMDNLVSTYRSRANSLYKASKKSGLLNQVQTPDGGYATIIAQALEGDFTHVRPNQKALINDWKELFEEARVRAEAEGLNITKRPNYFPIRLKDSGEIVDALTSAIDPDMPFHQIPSKLKDALAKISGMPVEDDATLRAALDAINHPQTKEAANRMFTRARAQIARTDDEISWLIRDSDPLRVFDRWITNTFEHAMYRNHIFTMRTIASTLKGVDNLAYDYTTRHIQDILGVRKGTLVAGLKEFKEGLRAGLAKGTLESIETYLRGLYAAYLGMSPRALIRNMTQPYFMTIGELSGLDSSGSAYMHKQAFKAFTKALYTQSFGAGLTLKTPLQVELATSMFGRPFKLGDVVKTRSMNKLSQLMGLSGRYTASEVPVDTLAKIQTGEVSSVAKNIAKAHDTLGRIAMAPYSGTDSATRYITKLMSDDVVVDYVKALRTMAEGGEVVGDQAYAIQAVMGLPGGYKPTLRKLSQSIMEGSEDAAQELSDLMTRYLNAKTMLDYSKISSAEMVRAWGSFVTMFSKWPLTVTSDIATKVKKYGGKEGGIKVARQYFAPLYGLAGLQAVLNEAGFDPEKNLRAKAILGAKGLQTWAPVDSFYSALRGDVFRSPMLSFTAGVGQALASVLETTPDEWVNLKEDMDKGKDVLGLNLNKSMEQISRGIMFGAPWMRFFLEDLPRLMGEGSLLKESFGTEEKNK